RSLEDLLRKDVVVVLADPKVAAIGLVVRDALRKSNRWEPLNKKSVSKATEPLVPTDIIIGSADAGIVWETTAAQLTDKLESITIDELKDIRSSAGVAVLRSCEHPASALRFARYLSARDE